MGRKLPDSIPDPFQRIPAGLLGLRIGAPYEATVGQEIQYYSIAVPITLVEPQDAQYVGQEYTQNFIVGSRDDPGAENPETFARGLSRFKRLCVDGLGFESIEGYDIEEVFNAMRDQLVAGSYSWEVRGELNRSGEADPRAGQINANPVKWMRYEEAQGKFAIDYDNMQRAEERSATVKASPSPAGAGRPGPGAARPGPRGGSPAARGPVQGPSPQAPQAPQPAAAGAPAGPPPAPAAPGPRPTPGPRRLR